MIRKFIAKTPWAEILIANGVTSIMIGLCLLWAVASYSLDIHTWVKASSPDVFRRVLRLFVLIYAAYGLTILFLGFVFTASPAIMARLSRRRDDGNMSETATQNPTVGTIQPMDLNELTRNERIVAEHAVLAYQAVKQAAKDAPAGQVTACMQQVVQDRGSQTLMRMIELSASEYLGEIKGDGN